MIDPKIGRRTVTWGRDSVVLPPQRPRWQVPAAIGGVALVVIAILLILTLGGRRQPPPCAAGQSVLAATIADESQGHYALAANVAQSGLGTPNLCAEARTGLTNHFVTDTLEAIYTAPFAGVDLQTQRQLVDQYEQIEQYAASAHAPFPTSMQVFERAYSVGQFDLARTTFEDAFRAQEVTLSNRDAIREYLATLVNEASWMVQAGGQTETDGLRMLDTAYLLDNRLEIGSGAAYGKLVQLLGADQSIWPTQPYPSPVLDATQLSSPGQAGGG